MLTSRVCAMKLTLFSICYGCSGSSGPSGERGIVDDRSTVTSFPISLVKGGKMDVLVQATNDKNSQIYRNFVKHRNELESATERGGNDGKYPRLRAFDYRGPEARYSLIVPDYSNDTWYLVCPYRVRLTVGTGCILYGKIDEYVFRSYIYDVDQFSMIVSAVKDQARRSIK